MGKRKCSDCGTVFSDSRSSCPKCYSESYEELSNNDYVQSKEALPKIDVKVRCSNCGNVFSKSKSVCPKCFARNEEATTVHSTSQSTSYTSSAKPSRGFVIAMIALGTVFVFIFAAAFSGKSASKKDNTVKATTTTTKTTTTTRATEAAPKTTTTKATETAPQTTTTTVQSNESVPQDNITLADAEQRINSFFSSNNQLGKIELVSDKPAAGVGTHWVKKYTYVSGLYNLYLEYDPNANNKVTDIRFSRDFCFKDSSLGETENTSMYLLQYAPLCIIDNDITDSESLITAAIIFIKDTNLFKTTMNPIVSRISYDLVASKQRSATMDDVRYFSLGDASLENYDHIYLML